MPLQDYNYSGGSLSDVLDANVEPSELQKLAHMALTPLGYLASTLDKPGRAVRGLLAGKPEELLNLIPLSDTLGITDPNNTVSGRDLLRHYGMVGEEDNWGNFAAGVGAEMLLDPINFFTLGTKSTLTALGKADTLTNSMAKTAAERIHSGQSGLVGLRTPWYSDLLGAPKADLPLLTGPWGEYFAGQAASDLRSVVDKTAPGRFVTGALDKANAVRQTLFTPGAGYSMDPRITGTSARVADETGTAVRAASLEKRMAITDQARQAHEFLAGHGVPPDLAEDAIGRAVTMAAEGIDTSLYKAKNVLEEYLTQQGKPVNEISKQLDELVKPIAQNRDVFDILRQEQIAAGIKVKNRTSPWGNQYIFDQSQDAMGAVTAQTKARKIPDSVLPGGKTQFNDLANDTTIAGIATAPVPEGMSTDQWLKMLDETKATKRKEIFEQARAARDKKFPTGETATASPSPVAPSPLSPLPTTVGGEVASAAKTQTEKTINDLIGKRDFLAAERSAAEEAGATARGLKKLDLQIDKLERQIDKQTSMLYDLAEPNVSKRADFGSDVLESAARGTNVPAIGNVTEDSTEALFRLQEEAAIKAEQEAAREARKTVKTEAVPTTQPPPTTTPLPTHPPELSDDRLWEDAGKVVNILADLPQDKVQASRGFYRGDMLGGATKYTENAATLASKGKAALTVMAEQIVDREAIRANPRDFIRADKALKKIGLTGAEIESSEAGKYFLSGGKVTLLDNLADLGKSKIRSEGKPLPYAQVQKELKTKYVPRDIVEKLATDVNGVGYIKSTGARQFLESATSTIKAWLTLPFIPFHTRNMLEGFTQQALTGGLGRENVADAAMYIGGAVKDAAKKAELDRFYTEALNHGAAFKHQMGELLGSSVVGKDLKTVRPAVPQTGNNLTQGILNWASDFKPSKVAARGEKYATFNPEKSAIIQQAAKVSAAGDDLQRFSHYIGLRREGYAAEAAAQMVSDAHLDYGKLTPFERDVMKNVVPFYAFSRRNMSRMAGQMQNPGPISSLVRAVSNSGDFVPGYVGQGSIPIPGGEDGKQRYLSGFSMPFEDELFGGLVSTLSGDWRTGMNRGLQSANPLLKLGVVLGTGRDLYTGRNLDEVTPTGLASLFPGTSGNVVSQLVSATPAGRVVNTVNSAIGGKDQFMMLKLLSGIRTTDIDQEMALQDAATAQVSRQLKRTGMVNTSESLYPKQQYRDPENQPMELQSLLELMSSMKQRGREMRKERVDSLLPGK